MVKVTVITPAWNAERYLPETIRSVLGQTLPDFEWIVVDDGSTDGTPRLLSSVADPRLRVVRQENRGVSAARNAALDLAQGDYVTFLDADDVLPERSLELRAAYLDANPEVGIVDGAVSSMDAALGRELRRREPSASIEPLFPRLVALDERFFAGVIYLVRANVLGGARFEEGLAHGEDLLFFLAVARRSDLVYGSVPEVVYRYRTGHGSAMADLDGLERGYAAFLQALAGRFALSEDLVAGARGRVSRIMTRSWLRRGRPLRALTARSRLAEAARAQ